MAPVTEKKEENSENRGKKERKWSQRHKNVPELSFTKFDGSDKNSSHTYGFVCFRIFFFFLWGGCVGGSHAASVLVRGKRG